MMKDWIWLFQWLAFIALINAVWVGFWALLAASSTWGAHLSKKVGTNNEHTNTAITYSATITKNLLRDVGARLFLAIVAYAIYRIRS